MTALAQAWHWGPIALGMGKPGSEIQAPMAIVIFFGLLTSTALNMAVVPTAYYRFRKQQRPFTGYAAAVMSIAPQYRRRIQATRPPGRYIGCYKRDHHHCHTSSD
jgi:hypothetical protein